MQLEHHEILPVSKDIVWDKISDMELWASSFGKSTTVEKKDSNTYNIKTSLPAGFLTIRLEGTITYQVIQEKEKQKITLDLKSKSIDIYSIIDVRLEEKSKEETILYLVAETQFKGAMAGMASSMAKNVLNHFFKKFSEKLQAC